MIAFACEKVTAVPLQLTVLAASLPEQDAIITNPITTIHKMKSLILILISLRSIVMQLILK